MDPVTIGLIAGSVVGTGSGIMEGNKAKKEQKQQEEAAGIRPRRRRLAKATEQYNAAHQQRLAGMSLLSQAARDWADSVRY